jgi:hypothetical protein
MKRFLGIGVCVLAVSAATAATDGLKCGLPNFVDSFPQGAKACVVKPVFLNPFNPIKDGEIDRDCAWERKAAGCTFSCDGSAESFLVLENMPVSYYDGDHPLSYSEMSLYSACLDRWAQYYRVVRCHEDHTCVFLRP